MSKKKFIMRLPVGLREASKKQIDEVKTFVKKGKHAPLLNFLATLCDLISKSEREEAVLASKMPSADKSFLYQNLVNEYLEACEISQDYLDSSFFDEKKALEIERVTENTAFETMTVNILQQAIDLSYRYEQNNRGPINALLIWGQLMQNSIKKLNEKRLTQNILDATYQQMLKIYPARVLVMSKYIMAICWKYGVDFDELDRKKHSNDVQELYAEQKKNRQEKSFSDEVMSILQPQQKKKICFKSSANRSSHIKER